MSAGLPVLHNRHNGAMPGSRMVDGRPAPRSGSEDQSLVRYWLVIRERIWVIVACTVIVLTTAIAYVALAPRTYTAQAELQLQPAATAATADPVLSALPVLHATGDPVQDVLTGASLVTTPQVAAAVVSSLHLKMSPADALAAVKADPIGQTSLVAVQATGSSPALVTRLADGFVDQAVAQSTIMMHAAISRVLPTLRQQLAAIPAAQRYGPGSQGAQVAELSSLQSQNDPTRIKATSAALPTAASSPKTKVTLIAGLFAGLLVGVGAAFLLHALDPRIRRDEQLRERFGLPILARIPRQPHGKRPRPLLPSELSPGAQEGYRTLRTVVAARARPSEARVVMVTGSAPGEGKSTTSMGLAAALAHGGARVLLIEADLRKPTFAKAFKFDESEMFGRLGFNGIEQVLTGKVELAKAVLPVRIDGAPLRVLAAHRSTGDVASRMSLPLVRKLVNDANAISDFVVIDSAPLTAVIDALPFAQLADEVIIVTRLDSTRINRLQELTDLLAENGVKHPGVVLVGERPVRGGLYYYGDGGRGQGASSSRRAGISTSPSAEPLPET